ncbi:CotD family spore coat protein [Bacillus sp. T33-2]|uniref:CotD family spore coat protein n=1 Tax=Bacillus sp. T33-2 TaxID=2054168 RepID=UPI000C794AAF|nr:CotD family spore coat protein [Bacillus sp. T33-2]PLR99700.1 spore coat protein CotH [Bacillus sp. T33-2]
MFCRPTNILPAVVHPTKCCVNHSYANNIVPHIHPSHTTNVLHTNYDNIHYFPHTQSTVATPPTSQNYYGGPGPGPFGPGFRPRPRPFFGR